MQVIECDNYGVPKWSPSPLLKSYLVPNSQITKFARQQEHGPTPRKISKAY